MFPQWALLSPMLTDRVSVVWAMVLGLKGWLKVEMARLVVVVSGEFVDLTSKTEESGVMRLWCDNT